MVAIAQADGPKAETYPGKVTLVELPKACTEAGHRLEGYSEGEQVALVELAQACAHAGHHNEGHP